MGTALADRAFAFDIRTLTFAQSAMYILASAIFHLSVCVCLSVWECACVCLCGRGGLTVGLGLCSCTCYIKSIKTFIL